MNQGKSPEDKKAEKEGKLERILSTIKKEDYNSISTDDEKVLQAEVDSMRKSLGVEADSMPGQPTGFLDPGLGQ